MLKLLQFVLIIMLIVVIECLPLDRFVYLSLKSNRNTTDNLKFSRSNLNTMGQDSERDSFMKRLAAFNELRGVSMTSSPTNSERPLDLFFLYTVVKYGGGFQEVSKKKGWKAVAVVLNSSAESVQKQYIEHLLPFECTFDRCGIDFTNLIPQVESKSNKSKDAMLQGHSDNNSQSGFPPTPTSMEPPSSPYPSGPSPIGNNYPSGHPQSHPGMYPKMTAGNPESDGPDDEDDSGLKDWAQNLGLKTAKRMTEGTANRLVTMVDLLQTLGTSKVIKYYFPGSADSNLQGSYPQSTTSVQYEGHTGHNQPPGQGYLEHQNYPLQGAMNDYGPNHHLGQPPQQPPSSYGNLGGHLLPRIQQQMYQPPHQQSQHLNWQMMQSGYNNYPHPGNPAIGSHYPPPPHPGSGPAPGYPGAQHYQYPPYPYHQPPHGQYPQQHPSHYQQHLSLPLQQGYNYLPPSSQPPSKPKQQRKRNKKRKVNKKTKNGGN